jgi:glycosyltransferase involved in cell wall biosynthesis
MNTEEAHTVYGWEDVTLPIPSPSMKPITVLIFSRNNVAGAIELIQSVYGLAQEFVLIDSSGQKQRAELRRTISVLKLDKIRTFHAVALGYADPLRMYGLSKCSNDWVLYLDVDERVSERLKRELQKVISRPGCDAFAIKRYEEAGDDASGFFTWQVRLFRKSKVLYKGLLHEQAEVNGKLCRIENSDFYLEHRQELRNPSSGIEYSEFEQFERMSYRTYNEKMLEYFIKATMPEKKTFSNNIAKHIIKGWLFLYESVTLRKQEQELGNFDYLFYYLAKSMGYSLKRGRLYGGTIRGALEYLGKVREWKSSPNGKEFFEISQIINKEGVIHFLGLDTEKTILALNRKYSGKRQGIDLLKELLIEKYRLLHAVPSRGKKGS